MVKVKTWPRRDCPLCSAKGIAANHYRSRHEFKFSENVRTETKMTSDDKTYPVYYCKICDSMQGRWHDRLMQHVLEKHAEYVTGVVTPITQELDVRDQLLEESGARLDETIVRLRAVEEILSHVDLEGEARYRRADRFIERIRDAVREYYADV